MVLVVCGSENTEVAYLKGLRGLGANRAVDLRIVPRPKAPAQVVAYAIGYAKGREFDEVWCVFDVDSFDLTDAARTARAAGVRLAVSNPCFELWLLLHHEDCRAHLTGYPQVAQRLRRHLPEYDKGRLSFDDFAKGVTDAVDRSRALEPTGADFTCNPSTGMWCLAEKIMER